MRRRAFTLVELLVVIGIIALLISILLPTLAHVRKASEATKCATNLHGMAQAWAMYCNEYKICVPGRLEKLVDGSANYGVGDSTEYRPRWYELLGAQVGQFANKTPKNTEDDTWQISNEWFLCPAVLDWNNSRNYPYGYNYQFLGDTRPKGSRTAWGAKIWVNYPVPSSRPRNTSETVMIADSIGTAATTPKIGRQGYYNDGTKDQDAVGNKGYLLDPPRLTGDSDRADAELSPNYRTAPDARHMGKLNAAYVDGHVSLVTMQDIGYVVNADGSIPTSAAGATNRYFSATGQDDDPPSSK
jgi:prepilin-type N-terminal cleavage/methylation domain-containing protein/prepilin-type processing-associated H-X9-DG protein